MEPALVLLLITGAVALLGLLWLALAYNALVRLRNYCNESWSDIDTELQRRYELIPNLVATVQGYAKHERETLERVIEARNTAQANHGSIASQAKDENVLVGQLRHLFAVAEAYPDLKANQNFLHLQHELVNTEDRIQRARRFYNANVRDLNVRIDTFPTNLVAGLFGFQPREFFEIEDGALRSAPQPRF
jgi:LemA protein